ncbi:MAG TPA: alpha/beta fold hydrolase [Candidatus Angelobacter sp.]|jgi:dipeptidyl aminopeptidase/acylaminoacyl peptidase|nr:alpha/beta fold hydrolase [Candidatus Angelobacter sp.]
MRSALKVGSGIAGLAGAAWMAACSSLYWHAFRPMQWGDDAERGWTPADLGLPHESLETRTRDGLRLIAWYLPGTRPAAVVVSGGHRGRAGDVLGISAALQRAGFHVVVYGWRGTPGSDPAAHTLGVYERRDLEAAIDAVTARVGDVPIGLLGYSLGGAVSLVVAADEPRVRAVCADSAFSDPLGVLADGVERVLRIPGAVLTAPVAALLARRTGAHLPDFRPLAAVGRIAPRPLLLIHGDADTAVPVRHARRLFDAAGEPRRLWVVPGAGHVGAYFADREHYLVRVRSFFEHALTADGARPAATPAWPAQPDGVGASA